jgi:hypothetical protein
MVEMVDDWFDSTCGPGRDQDREIREYGDICALPSVVEVETRTERQGY